ncbi:MAG: hypothetical protein AAF614_28570 [Chloroflexota bacterium]
MVHKSWKTKLRRAGVILLLLWGLLVLWGYWFAWRKVPTYSPLPNIVLAHPLLTGAEYETVMGTHPRPYLVELTTDDGGSLLLFGAEHTKDPNNPQIQEIRRRWEGLEPTVALVESDLGILFPGLMEPVETFGEPGVVHALARQAGIPTYTWEPPLEAKIAALLAQPFSQEQIALSVILSPYFSNRRFGRPADPEGVVAEIVRKRRDWPGIEGVLGDVTAVNQAWQNHFPNGPDWRDVSDEYGLPGFLGQIDGNLARDEHFVRVIIDLVEKGERVFAVAGSSHAVKLEAALQATLTP